MNEWGNCPTRSVGGSSFRWANFSQKGQVSAMTEGQKKAHGLQPVGLENAVQSPPPPSHRPRPRPAQASPACPPRTAPPAPVPSPPPTPPPAPPPTRPSSEPEP